MVEVVATERAIPGELLVALADAAEAVGLDESRPQDVARVLRGGDDEQATPAALRLAKRVQRLAAEADGSEATAATASSSPALEYRADVGDDGVEGGSA